MANGISSAEMVIELGKCGALGFFGAGGLSLTAIEEAVKKIKSADVPFGFNLINNPSNYQLEKDTVDLYIQKNVELIEASAYINLTPALIKFAFKGLKIDENGKITRKNKIIAKVSRVEVGNKFFSSPPPSIIRELIESGELTRQEGELALQLPVSQDMTAEADSGGHTDNRPAPVLISAFMELRNETQKIYDRKFRIGFGGGIGSPQAAAAAFNSGCAYVTTGSINQISVEAGTSDTVKFMLKKAGQADTASAPSADMFELGAKVQVLKKGTLFPMRAQKLYNIYNAYSSIENIPNKERQQIEQNIFRESLEHVWTKTKAFFQARDPEQIIKAEKSPKYKMALIFRSYLGQAAKWPIENNQERIMDYQIWTGPAIGAFNAWTKGTYMDNISNITVKAIALNILYGAAVLTRLSILRQQNVELFDKIELKPEPRTSI